MKKILAIIATAILSFMVGCTQTPTAETLKNASYAVGVSSALVVNQTNVSSTNKTVVIEIVKKIQTTVPTTNVSFEVAWTPIAKSHIADLVKNGKIKESEGNAIMTCFTAAIKTVDYFVYNKWPKIGQDVELLKAATSGYCEGYIKYAKTGNTVASKDTENKEYNKEAYDYMLKLVNPTK